jgi:hypothetical protein
MNEKICPHCKMNIKIRNPSGFCDHLYYPEYCDICMQREITENKNESLTKEQVQRFMDSTGIDNKDVNFFKSTIDHYGLKRDLGDNPICKDHPESVYFGLKDKIVCCDCLINNETWALVNMMSYVNIGLDTISKGLSNLANVWQNLPDDQKNELMMLVQSKNK